MPACARASSCCVLCVGNGAPVIVTDLILRTIAAINNVTGTRACNPNERLSRTFRSPCIRLLAHPTILSCGLLPYRQDAALCHHQTRRRRRTPSCHPSTKLALQQIWRLWAVAPRQRLSWSGPSKSARVLWVRTARSHEPQCTGTVVQMLCTRGSVSLLSVLFNAASV